ncbi:MAG: dihydroorotase [Pseudomonadales bacterium]|jgi:dihydroorotase|nr:dihydroorotase [Pseudomonadales bacterium]MCP5336373.1 dihydroorotase [Pseudomonadales bacterium]
MNELEILQPDDWHLHLRDGAALALTVNATARVFRRAIVMPNLKSPVTTTAAALAYRERIVAALEPGQRGFEPLMTLYLTDNTPAAEIQRARESGMVHAVKLYPAGATTNSDAGVTDLARCGAALAALQQTGMPLLVHGEVTSSEVDVFDRERVFIERVLAPLLAEYPRLRVVLEHITTAEAVAFVESGPDTLAATITAHHLLYNRNHLLAGAVRPHFFCLPVLKRDTHQRALIRAATSGSPRFFLGTDSAPHARHTKECASGCAGIFSAHAALESYASVFEAAGALDRLEAFASQHGPDFYGLERNRTRVRLAREPWAIPQALPFGDDTLVPMCAGETITWRVWRLEGGQ